MNIRIIIFALVYFICISVSGQIRSAEKIYKHINDAVVRIYTYHDDNTLHAQGSGVIILKKGWIVTNYHVLGDATVLYAEHNGKFIKLDSILAIDSKKDIMILQLSKPSNLKEYKSIPSIRIGNSDGLRVGQKIYAIGSPFGFENTITEGIISGLRTSFDSTQNFMQISAPISSGSSGGAVINSTGELIGISTMVITGETAQNLNFAILINDVLTAAQNTIKKITPPEEKTANYYYQKGYIDYLSKKYVSAIFNYEKALALSDQQESGLLLYYIGTAYQKLGMLNSAISSYKKSLEKIETAESYVALGSIYYEKNDLDTAIHYYAKAIEGVPSFYEAYVGLGQAYYSKGDNSNAIAYLKKLFRMNVKSAKAYFILGQIAYGILDYDSAVYFFLEAIKVDVNYAEAYFAVANSYLKKGETENAIKYQQKAHQLNPELQR